MAAIKALQQWCRVQCDGYRDVTISNMTTSFRDGLAFCALIHRHRPDLIDFDSLKKENVLDNNKLAFSVAEQELGIPALLDAEDMVALRVPDRLSILTYVSQYYNYFHGRSPIGGMGGIKRPAEGSVDEPSGKKNQPVTSKVFPSSKPGENAPPPSGPAPPTWSRDSPQNVPEEKSGRAGTLSSRCVSCSQHVHLVQRHLVEGRLYHRHCARSLSSTLSPLRDLPTNTQVSRQSPGPGSNTGLGQKTQTSSAPSWRRDSSAQSAASLSSPVQGSLSGNSVARPFIPPSSPRPASGPPSTVRQAPKDKRESSAGVSGRFAASGFVAAAKESLTEKCQSGGSSPFSSPSAAQPASASSLSAAKGSTASAASWSSSSPDSTTPSATVSTGPSPAPRTSTTAAKTHQSRLRFLQSDTVTTDQEKKTSTINLDLNPAQSGKDTARAGPGALTAGGKVMQSSDKQRDQANASGAKQDDGKASQTKSSAAAFLSKKLAEENAKNSSTPSFTSVALKKTDKPQPQGETPKKPTEGVRGRVRLKADPSILADLRPPDRHSSTSPNRSGRTGGPGVSPNRSGRTGGAGVSPNRSGRTGGAGASPNRSASAHNAESPADWRLKLKPVSKETKPAPPPPSSPRPPPWAWFGPAGPSSSVAPPHIQSAQNGQKEQTADQSQSRVSKMKPDYIPKEQILQELQQIEDDLNLLERRGVDLELKLRRSEEEGDDDSLMDELMVEWFNLIRNKQVAMRRESELVYIGRTQDLEEEQPTVEQELRALMEKPEGLKTARDRKREAELMAKLVEIVNDRNAIVEGLDEDRIREGEEDEELNKMMKTFSIKKDKPKKKSPMSKLFGWGGKKEG